MEVGVSCLASGSHNKTWTERSLVDTPLLDPHHVESSRSPRDRLVKSDTYWLHGVCSSLSQLTVLSESRYWKFALTSAGESQAMLVELALTTW